MRRGRVDWQGFEPPPRREAPGFPRLAVGDDGTVYGPSGQSLKRRRSGSGLFLHCPSHPSDDGRTYFPVDEVVCAAFHGPRPSPDHQAQNLNGDMYDNRPENVAWVLKRSARQTGE